MKCGIQEELLFSFLATKFHLLPVQNGEMTSYKNKHLFKIILRVTVPFRKLDHIYNYLEIKETSILLS